MDTLTDKEHDSTVDLSATNCTDFELLASMGEELVWKYESFDFTVEWFASKNDAHTYYLFPHSSETGKL